MENEGPEKSGQKGGGKGTPFSHQTPPPLGRESYSPQSLIMILQKLKKFSIFWAPPPGSI